jgi:hypothetical protein
MQVLAFRVRDASGRDQLGIVGVQLFGGDEVGVDSVAGSDPRGAARIVVTPLPGGSGVALDYEIFNPATPDRIRGDIEHTMVARTYDRGTVMVIGHEHAGSVAILRETRPGVFEVGA